jgi:hypothetical protein
MISARPQPGYAAGINASYGNYNSTRLSGFVNAGNDTLAARVAFSHKYRHGYTTNIQPGQDDLNGENDWGARLAALDAVQHGQVDLVYTYDRQRDPGTGFTSLVYPTTQGPSDPFGTVQLSGSPYSATVLGAAKLGIARDVHDVNLTGTVQLAPGLTFTTVNGFRTFHSHEVFDADGSRAFYLEFAEDAQGEQYSHEGASTTTARIGAPRSGGTPLSRTASRKCRFRQTKAPIWPAPRSAASPRFKRFCPPMAWAPARAASTPMAWPPMRLASPPAISSPAARPRACPMPPAM